MSSDNKFVIGEDVGYQSLNNPQYSDKAVKIVAQNPTDEKVIKSTF